MVELGFGLIIMDILEAVARIAAGGLRMPLELPPAEFELDLEGNLSMIKSINCDYRSYIRFTNLSSRAVNVYWVNYEGRPQKYKLLNPSQFLDINTFATHPWIFMDAITHERFVINNKKVFRGLPDNPRFPHSTIIRSLQRYSVIRMNWNITAPLRDLKTNAILAICDSIRDEEAATKLELPASLEAELVEAMRLRNRELEMSPVPEGAETD